MIEFGYYSPPDLRIPQSSYMQPFPFGDGHSKEAKVNPLMLGGPPAFQWCDKQDVILMRHFVDVIAPMFDHGGWKKTFASRIPHIATAHRSLFKAISAISAVSLGIMGFPQAVDPRQLRWDSFNSLDVMDPGAVEIVDDPQFLAINLLKMFDSFDRSIDPSWSLDGGLGVLQGPQTLNLGQITLVDQLRQDTSWMSLRMQLYFAVINQEPCSVSLSLDSESGLGEDNDYQWARKMILHLHNVVNYCFEDDKDGSTYNELVAYAQEWVKLKPVTFDPIFVGDAQAEDEFPDIFVLNDAVAQGWQMYHLSRILLVAHDHNRPMLGPSGALVRRSIDKSLRKDAQIVCSIANCIDDGINPAHLAACMAISLTGHLFTRESEQKSLLNILVQTEKQFGWPTATIQTHVRETWES
ncbi:hypothetical protein KJ359_003755 [Pestalotiopsis sp. 9143b]|nr:hypothetical protein KJ359_003755 [Pestalotiopsis sp. 9143b]